MKMSMNNMSKPMEEVTKTQLIPQGSNKIMIWKITLHKIIATRTS